MEFEVKLTGFKELADALRDLPDNISKNVLRSAVSAAAAEIRVEAKNNALRIRRSGTLARSIYQKQIRELSGPEKQTFYVGSRKGKKYQRVGKKGKNLSADAYYAPFVEFGHFTRPARKGTGHVHWVPPHPFMRPAFDTKKEAAIDAMAKKLADRIVSYRVKGK